jgi:hypothetical protein
MMHTLAALLALLAAPFWETKAPQDWSDEDIELVLHDSPWAQTIDPQPVVQVFLATAKPVREAEDEFARRAGKAANFEYQDYMKGEGARNVVLAVAYPKWAELDHEKESARMQEECVMKVGRKKYGIIGHFPPIPSDKYLRLVYPRVVTEADKSVVFELYLPDNGPYREVEFRVKEMMYKGKLEM